MISNPPTSDIASIENRATISRTTAGITKFHGIDPQRDELLHRYIRDVHSPAIARRAGVHLYRHFSFGAVDPDFLGDLGTVSTTAEPAVQLTGAGHLDYLDEASLAAFYESPHEPCRDQLLADINVIGGAPGRSTTYRTSPGSGWTFLDATGEPMPQGRQHKNRFALFLRSRRSEGEFRRSVAELCHTWSRRPGIQRLRMQLFDPPDISPEVLHGYPVFPAPPEEHYQGWLDVVLADSRQSASALGPEEVDLITDTCSAVHVQPVTVVYTYVWNGRPTVVGLRGYPAWELIMEFGATHQTEPSLLEWLYGFQVSR